MNKKTDSAESSETKSHQKTDNGQTHVGPTNPERESDLPEAPNPRWPSRVELPFALRCAFYVLCCVLCALSYVPCALCSVIRPLCYLLFALCPTLCTLTAVLLGLRSALCALQPVLCTCSLLWAVCSAFCDLRFVL